MHEFSRVSDFAHNVLLNICAKDKCIKLKCDQTNKQTKITHPYINSVQIRTPLWSGGLEDGASSCG